MRWEWHLAVAVAATSAVVVNAPEKIIISVIIFLGSIGIDIFDHGLYALMTIRPLTVDNIRKVGWEKYRKMEPGFYFFHLMEVYTLGWLLYFYLGRSSYGLWFMAAYTVHLLMDFYQYATVWKNMKWLKYWTIGGWIVVK